MPKDLKRLHERSIFERFCDAEGSVIIPGTIEQPDPPAPDLTAEVHGLGRVAFELVRLDDDDDLTAVSLMRQAVGLLEREFAALAPGRRAALVNRLSDAEVTVHFSSGANNRERTKALPFVWRELEELQDGFDGQMHFKGGAPDTVESVWVVRAEAGEGPRFRTMATGSPLPLRGDRIAEKLKKTYECDVPLGPLAYCHIGELAHITDQAMIMDVVTQRLPASQFRRVWVYEGLLRRVALRFPA